MAGGAERTIDEISRRLSQNNHEVTLVSPRYPGCVAQEETGSFRIIRVGGPVSVHLLELLVNRELVRPDVVIDDLAHVVPWCTPQLLGGPGVAFFRHLHRSTLPGQVPSSTLANILSLVESTYPRIYRHWIFVTHSQSSTDDLASLGVERKRIQQIALGVDSDVFVPCPKSERPTVVYFGGLRRYKRPELVIGSFRLVLGRFPEARLIVVGTGPEYDHLRALAARSLPEQSIEFAGRLDRQRLARAVGEAWVNVHTSIAEGWCLTAMEAAAADTPTVAVRVAGIRDSILPGESGLLVDSPDSGSVAKAICAILENPDSWRGKPRRYAVMFSWDDCSREFERILVSAIRDATVSS